MRAASILLFSALPALGAAAETQAAALRAAALGLFGSATQELASIRPSRERVLLEAVLLVNTSPLTEAQLDRADSMLDRIADEPKDEIALAARYYQGRIAQVHRREPRMDEARVHFRELWQESLRCEWSERALVQLTLVELYGSEEFPSPAILAGIESAGTKLTRSAVRRDFHSVLADYYLAAARPRLPSDGLRHLLAMEAAGELSRPQQADAWIRIARVSEELGHTARALAYYGRFASAVLRDNRLTYVRERIRQLEGTAVNQ